MTTTETPGEFSLLGGPLYRLGVRLGLVRDGNTVPMGIAIGLFLWIVMVGLALAGGVGGEVFSVTLIAVHVRLLLVIPLIFVCETVVGPRMATFSQSLVKRNIVPENQVPALNALVAQVSRLKNSWLAELGFLLITVFLAFGGDLLDTAGNSAGLAQGRVTGGGAWAAWWYWAVCLTVFRFLFLRIIWRILLWAYFLWRVSRLKLRLMPMHPDRIGGLGAVATVQAHFVPLIVGLSMLRAAQFAEEISSGSMAFEEIYSGIVAVLVLDVIVFIGPVLVFTPLLWRTRLKGLGDYMGLAANYVSEFDRKWVQNKVHPEPILGSADLQSLADLANSVEIVRSMRWAAVGPRMLIDIGMAVMLPMLPLMLFKFPITEIAKKLVTSLVGL